MPKPIQRDKYLRQYAAYGTQELLQALATTSDGLDSESVEHKQEQFGLNRLHMQRRDTLLYRLRRAFLNPFHMILLVLALASLASDVLLTSDFSHNVTTAIICCAMIFISGSIRLIQELRAKQAAAQLDRLIHQKVSVKRSGMWVELLAEELVVGDLVHIRAGDRIPADLRLIGATDLFVSQAAITGESAIREKHSHAVSFSMERPVTELDNLCLMATTVISGSGEGVVVAVGEHTVYGGSSLPHEKDKTSFERGANSIAWVMIRFMAVLVPVVFILMAITGGHWLESLAFALSVSVGLTPELLPMVITACLAKGSLAMSKKQTIIKDINAMQAFGCMDVLCMDKTGTLTNESIVLEYYLDVLGNESLQTLDLAYLNSCYHSGVRNPIDNALRACKTMPGHERHFSDLLTEYQKRDEVPFDYLRKTVSVLVAPACGQSQLIVKGDITQIVSRCTHVEYRGQLLPMEDDALAQVHAVVDDMLQDGMKVIAVARKTVGTTCTAGIEDECDLTLVGYVAFFDAPKASAKASVAALQRLKVTSKILTGDQPAVAQSICRRVGISPEHLLTGDELDAMSDAQLRQAVEQSQVFAQLTPSHKLRLVEALQANGHTVGFLGDGINDIPALHQADVGISVDTAVDAAKDSADVVLLQKDLQVLEQGILEGRKTFVNMLKYIKITASSNFGNILSIVCASAFLPFLPMTSVQILLLNLLYDILCIVLPWDSVDEEDQLAPKEWSGKTLGRFMRAFGPISSLFDILTFLMLFFVLCPAACAGAQFYQIGDLATQARFIALFQTGWFVESLWTQVLILHFLRTSKVPLVQSRPSTPVLVVTLAGIVGVTWATFTCGLPLFGLVPLPLSYLGYLSVVAAAYMLLTTLRKSFYQKKYGQLM